MYYYENINQIIPCEKSINDFWNHIPTCCKCDSISKCSKEINISNVPDLRVNTYKYVFIFDEPLSKTSIQYSELISLLRKFAGKEIQVNVKEYENCKDVYQTLDNDCYKVEVIRFKQSCIVKSNFKIDLKNIIAYSGYIHSCGEFVYCENWENVDTTKLTGALEKYIDNIKQSIDIVFYNDVDHKDMCKNLSGILIDKERTYLGNKFLSKEIPKIKLNLKGLLADKGIDENNNNNNIIAIYRDESFTTKSSDYSLYEDQRNSIILTAVHIMYKRENPLHKLDMNNEAKPYWAGIYTTPHNLTNAMLNLAQVKEGNIILDPFLHTGTTILEAAKYNCTVIGSELYEPIGAKDNVDILLNEEILEECINNIEAKQQDKNLIHEIFNIITKSIEEYKDHAFSDYKKVEEIIHEYPILEDINNRVIFYIIRRYTLRFMQGIKQPADSLVDDPKYKNRNMKPFEIFLENSINLLKCYCSILKYCSKNSEGWFPNDADILKDNILIDDLSISNAKRIAVLKNNNFKYFILQCSADKLSIPDNFIDIVITDPPYGYGDDYEPQELERLYIGFIREAFRVLKPNGGKLIMCALDKVKTGKPIHAKTSSWGLLSLIDKIAKEMNIQFIKKDLLPITGAWFIDYWKSKHALNRVVINLQISKTSEK